MLGTFCYNVADSGQFVGDGSNQIKEQWEYRPKQVESRVEEELKRDVYACVKRKIIP
jgi:hypothetical protein